MAENTLILEKQIPLYLEGIKVGTVAVKVYEGVPSHIQQGDMNEKYLIVKGIYNDKEYEVRSIRGGVDAAIRDLINKIESDLK